MEELAMSKARSEQIDGRATPWRFQPVSHYAAVLGESPVWCPNSESVWWVDCEGRKLINTDVLGGEHIWSTPETIGFVVLAFGRIIVGLETGLFAFDQSSERFEKVMALDEPDMRFNDAAVGFGHIWASTMHIGVEEPVGCVLRIGSDYKAVQCLSGYRRPNGLAVDVKRHRLYVSDSHPAMSSIETADIDPASYEISIAQPFGGGSLRPGRPDGAALGADGRYWIARVDAGLLDIHAPDGALVGTIRVPVPEPTKIAFGGADMRTLFLTSKSKGQLGGRLLSTRLDDVWPPDRKMQ
jgi:sugar lactone lactonase YvrE